MKIIGFLLWALLFECLLLMAWFIPIGGTGRISVAMSVIGGFGGPPIDATIQSFGFFVATPLAIIAAYLISRDD